MKNNSALKILLTIALLLAAVTGVIVWAAYGRPGTAVEKETAVMTAPQEETTFTEETTEEPSAETGTIPTEEVQTVPVEETGESQSAIHTLTQADFPQDKLTELTAPELKKAAGTSSLPAYEWKNWGSNYAGDIGECCSAYANLDLDKDGIRDSIVQLPGESGFYTFEVHFGNGTVLPLGITPSHEWGCCHFEFLFSDINGTGKDDILAVQVHQYNGAGGQELSIALFLDANGSYYRQDIQDIDLTMEDVGNLYVRISCPAVGYHEVIPFDESSYVLSSGETPSGVGFQRYFGFDAENGKTSHFRIQDVKLDGNKVVILYSFAQSAQMYLSENPTAAVWRLEPSGYFVIDRMGTDVIRDYWLTE